MNKKGKTKVKKQDNKAVENSDQILGNATQGPLLWFALIFIPVAAALYISMVRSDEPPPVARPEAPAVNEEQTVPDSSRSVVSGVPRKGGKRAGFSKMSCDFGEWVGLRGEGNTALATQMQSLERPYRLLPPGSVMTMDHSPARVNFDLNENGIITRIWCG